MLRLVVDNARTPRSSAADVVAWIRSETAPRVAVWRARRAAATADDGRARILVAVLAATVAAVAALALSWRPL